MPNTGQASASCCSTTAGKFSWRAATTSRASRGRCRRAASKKARTPRVTAFRELREEIGTDKAEIVAESEGWLRYDLPEELIGKTWDGRWRGQRQKWYVMRFTGRDADITIDTEHPEFTAWKWVPAEQLPSVVVSFKRRVYVHLLAEFPELSQGLGRLSQMLADPIVRMTMAADSVDEDELYDMLLVVAEHLRNKRHVI